MRLLLKTIYILSIPILLGQDLYEGHISFDYSGTVSGTFNGFAEDSIEIGGAINQANSDSASIYFMSVTAQGDEVFDLFLTILQDTIFPLQPRDWEIPGSGDEDNPLSLEAVLIFIPGVDSNLVNQLTSSFVDTSSSQDSLNLDTLVSVVLETISDNIYIGLNGTFSILESTDSTFSGELEAVLLKPAFHFPPHLITISDGAFSFRKPSFEILSSTNNQVTLPSDIKIYSPYPNPFNPVTKLDLFTPDQKKISVDVLNINGQLLEKLIDNKKIYGDFEIIWSGTQYPSGVYFFRVQSENFHTTKKAILIK